MCTPPFLAFLHYGNNSHFFPEHTYDHRFAFYWKLFLIFMWWTFRWVLLRVKLDVLTQFRGVESEFCVYNPCFELLSILFCKIKFGGGGPMLVFCWKVYRLVVIKCHKCVIRVIHLFLHMYVLLHSFFCNIVIFRKIGFLTQKLLFWEFGRKLLGVDFGNFLWKSCRIGLIFDMWVYRVLFYMSVHFGG